jgi:hypothetical protein
MLRHTHVLRNVSSELCESLLSDILTEFLGANETDDRPFIVMPYLKNGNVRDYVQNHPDCDRLQIV